MVGGAISFIRCRMFPFGIRLWRKPVSRIIISVSILSFLLTQLPLSDLWTTVRRVSFPLWTFALMTFVASHAVTSLKWRLLVNIGKNRMPVFVALRCHFAGLFANLFLPSLAGGDIVRAGMAFASADRKEPIIWGSLLDRFLDTCALMFLILIGALLVPGTLLSEGGISLLWIVLILFAFPLCTLFVLLVPLPRKIPRKLSQTVLRIREVIKSLIKHPTSAVIGLGIAICIQGGFVLLNALLGSVCGIVLPLSIWFFAWPMAKLAAMLPISIGGIGVREVALAELLGRFGIPASSAVGLALVWETILLAGGGIGGISYFLFRKRVSEPDGSIAEAQKAP